MAPGGGGEASRGVLGAYIRAQRQLADLSLRQLAGLTNVSNAYLSQVERGLHQPSVKVLRAIADALNLSNEALLAEAGLLSNGGDRPPPGVEAAVQADPHLAPDEKQILLGVYRTLRGRHRT